MAYQVLARKWRPQDFDSVVGQAPVVTALQNALTDGRVAQAYLFSGIRGVGKTSVARVFAKALNCENDPPSDPCNDCTSCAEIAAGSNLDVLEIDAATYSKVEQVRELTESLRYGPARDKYKVVIIDEVHRLSRQAFDALLKIVEEPPEHLVFMFATTEIEAVPATILSRCQSFQLRRVPLAEMVEHIGRISETEGLRASDHALRLIARASEGSVRDAVALLDQIATFGGGQVVDDEVGRILGGADLAVYQGLLQSILAGRSAEVSAAVRQIETQGWDPRHIYGDFLAFCRDALHLVLDPQATMVELPKEEAAALAREAEGAGYENLLRLLHQLLDSEMGVRRSESASLALEIALLRAAELPKLVAIEELLGGGGQPSDSGTTGGARSSRASAGGAKSAGQAVTVKPEQQASPAAPRPEETVPAEAAPVEMSPVEMLPVETPPAETLPIETPLVETPPVETVPVETAPKEATPVEEPREEPLQVSDKPGAAKLPPEDAPPQDAGPAPDMDSPVPEPMGADADQPGPEPPRSDPPPEDPAGPAPPEVAPPKPPPGSSKAVTQLLERVSYLKQPLAAHLAGAESLVMEGDTLVIATIPSDSVLERTLSRASNRDLLDETMAEMFGPAAKWRLVEGAGEVAAAATDNEDVDESEDVTQDPTVQAVLDLFGGQIESIEQRPNSSDQS